MVLLQCWQSSHSVCSPFMDNLIILTNSVSDPYSIESGSRRPLWIRIRNTAHKPARIFFLFSYFQLLFSGVKIFHKIMLIFWQNIVLKNMMLCSAGSVYHLPRLASSPFSKLFSFTLRLLFLTFVLSFSSIFSQFVFPSDLHRFESRSRHLSLFVKPKNSRWPGFVIHSG